MKVGLLARGAVREKVWVARHRTMRASGADQCERAIERKDRQRARVECEAGLAEYENAVVAEATEE